MSYEKVKWKKIGKYNQKPFQLCRNIMCVVCVWGGYSSIKGQPQILTSRHKPTKWISENQHHNYNIYIYIYIYIYKYL